MKGIKLPLRKGKDTKSKTNCKDDSLAIEDKVIAMENKKIQYQNTLKI